MYAKCTGLSSDLTNVIFTILFGRLGYEDFLQRYGVLLHSHSLPADRSQSAQTALNKTVENKENELLFEPLDLLYRKQLNMTDRRTTPKKKLRRRAGLLLADINCVGLNLSEW